MLAFEHRLLICLPYGEMWIFLSMYGESCTHRCKVTLYTQSADTRTSRHKNVTETRWIHSNSYAHIHVCLAIIHDESRLSDRITWKQQINLFSYIIPHGTVHCSQRMIIITEKLIWEWVLNVQSYYWRLYVIDIAWDWVLYEIYRHKHEGELPVYCIKHEDSYIVWRLLLLTY